MNNLLEIAKLEIKNIKEKHTYDRSTKKRTHFQTASVWEKNGYARLYIPRDAYESAGYIDLYTGECHRQGRSSNIDILKSVLNYLLEKTEDRKEEVEEAKKETKKLSLNEKRRNVMKMAWGIYRQFEKDNGEKANFASCLKLAWKYEESFRERNSYSATTVSLGQFLDEQD
jgi:hypothetical protein